MTATVDRAIVLRTWEFSETSQTVTLFTHDHGALRGLAKGARRDRSTFGGGFEALTLGDVVFRARSTTELALLTEWNVTEIFWGPRADLRAHRAALYASELIGAFITDREGHPGLFRDAVRFLRDLESPGATPEALLRLQWSVLVETGHRPRIDAGADSAHEPPAVVGFDPDAGSVVADPGVAAHRSDAGVWRIRSETLRVLRGLDDADRTAASPTPLSLDRANRFLAAWCRYQLGRELHTARVVFGSRSDWTGRGRRGTRD